MFTVKRVVLSEQLTDSNTRYAGLVGRAVLCWSYGQETRRILYYCNTAWNMDGVRHYPRWVRRLPGSTTSDQSRSCISTLSVPETTISSHRPELTHSIFSPGPSIRLSKLSANTTKHTSAAIW